MLFKKNDSRRWHPCLVITIGALAAIGAAAVAASSKRMMCTVKNKLSSMWKKNCEDSCSTDCEC